MAGSRIPPYYLKRAEEAERRAKELKSKVPDKYHIFLIEIVRSTKVLENVPKFDLSKREQELGFYWKDKTLLLAEKHWYLRVEGRLARLYDEFPLPDYRIVIHPAQFREIGKTHVCSVQVDIYRGTELVRSAAGTAQIHFGGTGVDATAPIENAETSALGRALAQLGVALDGFGGLASAEDMVRALTAKQALPVGGVDPETGEIAQGNRDFEAEAEEEDTIAILARIKHVAQATIDGTVLAKVTVCEPDADGQGEEYVFFADIDLGKRLAAVVKRNRAAVFALTVQPRADGENDWITGFELVDGTASEKVS